MVSKDIHVGVACFRYISDLQICSNNIILKFQAKTNLKTRSRRGNRWSLEQMVFDNKINYTMFSSPILSCRCTYVQEGDIAGGNVSFHMPLAKSINQYQNILYLDVWNAREHPKCWEVDIYKTSYFETSFHVTIARALFQYGHYTMISLVSTAAWIQIALWRPLDQQYKYVAYYTKSNALTIVLTPSLKKSPPVYGTKLREYEWPAM